MNAFNHPAMQAMQAAYQTVNNNRTRPMCKEFYHDTTYDGLPLSLLMERDMDGFHLREIWSMDGNEITWVPRHIAGLMKAQAIAEMEKEES